MLLMDEKDIDYLTVDSGYTNHRPLTLYKPKPLKKLKVIKKPKLVPVVPDFLPDEIEVP